MGSLFGTVLGNNIIQYISKGY